jgi:hypothetical protein
LNHLRVANAWVEQAESTDIFQMRRDIDVGALLFTNDDSVSS